MKKYMDRISLKCERSEFIKVKIKSSRAAYDVIKQFYHDDILLYESVFILLLDNSLYTIGYVKISQGGVARTVVDPILIAKYAIDTLAKCVVLAHNHPSGTLIASEADKELTKKIKEGLNLFNIQLIDHLILSADEYMSLADESDCL